MRRGAAGADRGGLMRGPADEPPAVSVTLRVRGRVQGVGFRPTVWRIARRLGLDGDVRNDSEGVLIRLGGSAEGVAGFRAALTRELPPLARIDRIETAPCRDPFAPGFSILPSVAGRTRTEIAPDAAVCPECADEIRDPAARRFGYALTNCTHCGPRLGIVRSIPYDRARTTMAPFALCADCLAEYRDPGDRRFHAEPIACPACGPKPRLVPTDRGGSLTDGDPIAAAADLIRGGAIVAVKGLGGYQLACDAANDATVRRLRQAKRREGKPFALMARDLAMVREFCHLSPTEERILGSPAAPIVLLPARAPRLLSDAIAPGLGTLGFMLPTTPLHLLLMDRLDAPVVMTSGNLSGEPQIIADDEALTGLAPIASHLVTHDRAVANRVDDSVVCVMAGAPRLLRRARGYAPAPIPLPPGFGDAPEILAMGGQIKSTFCLVKDGAAILSQHQGDLEHPAAFDDYRRNLALYRDLFDHAPVALAADPHPEYSSRKLARALSGRVMYVQHHHAHIAACLAENAVPRAAPPVLGIALDGLGWGEDGTLWGGEFLIADYRGFRRIARLKPVAMIGGDAASREPWRNLHAQILAAMGWPAFERRFASLDAYRLLRSKPLATLDAMMAAGFNAPLASSCGRLFDAVAAAVGLCAGRQDYEGDAAARLEALAATVTSDAAAYPFTLMRHDADDVAMLDPAPMWQALLADLAAGAGNATVAARFHRGLAAAIALTATALAEEHRFRAVALSGGCWQNALLLDEATRGLRDAGFEVLTHREVPANDGGLALGQAVVAAARLIDGGREGIGSCA
jgi:hydrogenase maturation protein HypF